MYYARGIATSYSKEIRKDVKDVLKVSLSAETIRPLLGKLKAAYHEKQGLTEAEKKRLQKKTQGVSCNLTQNC